MPLLIAAPPAASTPTRAAGGVDKAGKGASGVGAAPGTSHHDIGVWPAQDRPALFSRLVTDDPLQFAHHPRIGVRAHDRTQAVVGGIDRSHPVTQRLVHCVLQGPAPAVHRSDLRTQQLHAKHVEGLPFRVHLTHVHNAFHTEQGGGGGRGHPVLAGAGLGDQARFAHTAGQEGLADHVVELVRSGVGQVLPLEEHPDTQRLRQPGALGDRRRPAAVVPKDAAELAVEVGVRPGGAEGGLELLACRYQRLGHELAAELTESASGPGVSHQRTGLGRGGSRRRRLGCHSFCQSKRSSAAPPAPRCTAV